MMDHQPNNEGPCKGLDDHFVVLVVLERWTAEKSVERWSVVVDPKPNNKGRCKGLDDDFVQRQETR